jgi:hypothetical protein
LWATAMNPSGGALALAEAEAERIARSVDWTVLAASAKGKGEALERRGGLERALQGWLDPLTPPVLAQALASGPVGPAA